MTPQRAGRPAPSAGNARVGRTALLALALAAAGVLSGCTTSTSGAARSSDQASQQPPRGASGVTVFGDIDANVTRERTR